MRNYLIILFLAAACSSTELSAVIPTEADIVESFVQSGLTEGVSSCVVGLGSSQFEVDELDPAAVNPTVKNAVREFIAACERAENMMNVKPPEPEVVEVQEPFAYGDDPVLDQLWDQCAAGQGFACDELWRVAPLDSSYEAFGVTCGDRPSVLECSEVLLDP